MDCWLVGCWADSLAGWVSELLGLLGLLGLLEGVIGFLALLEGCLSNGLEHARRSERSADLIEYQLVAGNEWLSN